MRKKLIAHICTSLTNVGVNILQGTNPLNVWRLVYIYLVFFTVDLSTCMVSLTNYTDFNAFVTPAPYVAAVTVSLGCIHIVFYRRKLIRTMLYELDTNLLTYPDEHLLNISYKWYLQDDTILKLISLSIYCQYFFLFIVCIPIFGELVYYKRIKTLIYPCWTPWHLNNLLIEVFTFVLQFIQSGSGLWFNHVMTIFILIVVVEFVKQYERLIAAVSSLKYRSDLVTREKKRNTKKSNDQVLRENIIHCIRHHQMLHRCFRIFKIWFSAFFSLELSICVVTFAFALYVAMKASSLSQILNYFTVVSFIWINLLSRCLISEIFTSLNERLALALFSEVEWYEMNKSNRQLLLIFHQLANRPLRLFGLSVFEATRATFTKLVRTTYSIFNVLYFSVQK